MATVLIVDDNPAGFESLADVLEMHQLTPVGARSAEEALEIIARQPPDCILVDTVLPGMDGFELCEQLKSQPRTAAIPVIFVTGRRSDEAAVVRALDLGAADYLLKPVRIPELVARIQAAIRTKDVHAAALERPTAEVPPIEGREAFLVRLQEELGRSRRLHRPVSCVLIRLAFPPGVPERLGPERVTALEKQLEPKVRSCCRRGDIYAHLDGRCCAFILFSQPQTGGNALAERIRARVVQEPVPLEGGSVEIQVSVGVAGVEPGEQVSSQGLLDRCQSALERAQASGPNAIDLWTPGT